MDLSIRESAFYVPEKSSLQLEFNPRYKYRITSKPLIQIPTKNLATHVTCRLKDVFRLSENQTRLPCESGTCTDKDGNFIPRRGLTLLNRYICTDRIERKGQSAVLITAEDSFQAMQPVAIKVMHKAYLSVGLKEADTLRRLNLADPGHVSHTVRLQNAFMHDDHVCLVFPSLNPLPLNQVIAEGEFDVEKKLTVIRKVALHLLSALAFLKRYNTLHADLKPENVLVKSVRETKGENIVDSLVLVDFGNAINHTHEEVSLYYSDFDLQTLPYRAPEVCVGVPFGVEIDMWSLGCLLAELFIGKVLFPGRTRIDVLRGMTNLLGPLPEVLCWRGKFGSDSEIVRMSRGTQSGQKTSPFDLMSKIPDLKDYSFASFLLGLLKYSPDQRLTPWQALQHPFMSKEICIGHFMHDLPASQQLVSKSDYNFSQAISSDIKRMCPSTYDLLKTGTQQLAQSASIYRNIARVQPLKRFPSSSDIKCPLSSRNSGSSSKKRKSLDATFLLSDSKMQTHFNSHINFNHTLSNGSQSQNIYCENGIKREIHFPGKKSCVNTTTMDSDGIDKKTTVNNNIHTVSNRTKRKTTIPSVYDRKVKGHEDFLLHKRMKRRPVKKRPRSYTYSKPVDAESNELRDSKVINSTFTFAQKKISSNCLNPENYVNVTVTPGIPEISRNTEGPNSHCFRSGQQSCRAQASHFNDTFTIGRAKSNHGLRCVNDKLKKSESDATSEASIGKLDPQIEQTQRFSDICMKQKFEKYDGAWSPENETSMIRMIQDIPLDPEYKNYLSNGNSNFKFEEVNVSLRKDKHDYSSHDPASTSSVRDTFHKENPTGIDDKSTLQSSSGKANPSLLLLQDLSVAKSLSIQHVNDKGSHNGLKLSSGTGAPQRSEDDEIPFKSIDCLQNCIVSCDKSTKNSDKRKDCIKNKNTHDKINLSYKYSCYKSVSATGDQNAILHCDSSQKRKRKPNDNFNKDKGNEGCDNIMETTQNVCFQPCVKAQKVENSMHTSRMKVKAVEAQNEIFHSGVGMESFSVKECKGNEKRVGRLEPNEKEVDDVDPTLKEKSKQGLTNTIAEGSRRLAGHTRLKPKSKTVTGARRSLKFNSVCEETGRTTDEFRDLYNDKLSNSPRRPDTLPTEGKEKANKKRLLRESLLRDESQSHGVTSDPYEFKATPKDKRKKENQKEDKLEHLLLQGKVKADGISHKRKCTIGELVDQKIRCLKMKPPSFDGPRNSKFTVEKNDLPEKDSVNREAANNSICEPTPINNNNILHKPTYENMPQATNDQQRESNRDDEKFELNLKREENEDYSLKQDSLFANMNVMDTHPSQDNDGDDDDIILLT